MLTFHLKDFFLVLFITLSFGVTKAQDSYVTKTKVNLRKSQNPKSEILGTIAEGEVVGVLNSDNPRLWHISYFGNVGYVSSKLLVSLNESEKYKSWQRLNAETGDNFDCENIHPLFDESIDNHLTIHSGDNSDVVVKLMNYNDLCIRISYIRAGDSYTMKNIPLGNYYLKIAYGKDLFKKILDNQCIVKFLRNPVYKLGTSNLLFDKVQKPNEVIGDREYTNWSVGSFELSLNMEFEKGLNKSRTLASHKISESTFNK